jgi:hypothetical protein
MGEVLRVVFRDFKPGEIFDLVKKINRGRNRDKVISVSDPFTLPDTVAGVVELGESVHTSRYVPFRDEEVLEEIKGLKVAWNSEVEPMPDGSLAYAILADKFPVRWVFIKGDRIIERIEGLEVTELSLFFVLPDGTIAGNLHAMPPNGSEEDEVLNAFKEEHFIRKIGGKEVEQSLIQSVWSDGTLVGTALLKDERCVLFKGDILLDEVCGEKIINTNIAIMHGFQPDGALVTEVMLKDRSHAILKNDTLIKSIQGKRIMRAWLEPLVLSDGTLVGTVEVEGVKGRFLFIGDTLIDRIGGKRYKNICGRKLLPGDVVAGEVTLEDGRRVLFVGDRLIEEVNGKKILDGEMLFTTRGGEPVSLVKLEDGRELLLKGDTLIKSIGSRRVVAVEKPVWSLPDGTPVGTARLEDGRRMPFRGDDLLEKAQGKGLRAGAWVQPRCRTAPCKED